MTTKLSDLIDDYVDAKRRLDATMWSNRSEIVDQRTEAVDKAKAALDAWRPEPLDAMEHVVPCESEKARVWVDDCIHFCGRILNGYHSHWCDDWDFLPMDETCPEWPCAHAEEMRHERPID